MIDQDRTIEWIRVYEMFQVPDFEEVIHFIASTKQLKRGTPMIDKDELCQKIIDIYPDIGE